MVKAFIFDMDGVIIDSEPFHFKLEQQIFKSLGLEISKEEHLKFVGTTSHYMWDKVKTKYNLQHTLEELVRDDRDKYYNFLINGCEINPIDGVKGLIGNLYEHGLKLAIASSSPLDVIDTIVQTLDIKKYFHKLVTGDYIEKSKPEPDIFLYAASELQVSPDECFVIEDSHNGVLAAKSAGMKCIGYINKNSGHQDLTAADIIIENFSDLDLALFGISGTV